MFILTCLPGTRYLNWAAFRSRKTLASAVIPGRNRALTRPWFTVVAAPERSSDRCGMLRVSARSTGFYLNGTQDGKPVIVPSAAA